MKRKIFTFLLAIALTFSAAATSYANETQITAENWDNDGVIIEPFNKLPDEPIVPPRPLSND